MCQLLPVLPVLCVREKPSKASEQDDVITEVMFKGFVAGSVTTSSVIKWRISRDLEKYSSCL